MAHPAHVPASGRVDGKAKRRRELAVDRAANERDTEPHVIDVLHEVLVFQINGAKPDADLRDVILELVVRLLQEFFKDGPGIDIFTSDGERKKQ